MHNLDVYTLMTAPMSGVEEELSSDELLIFADVGRLAVNDYLRGLSAIGNITTWACENPNYTDHANDLSALAAFLSHTAQMVRVTSFYSDHADYMAEEQELRQKGNKNNG